jgi:hypothetical protein
VTRDPLTTPGSSFTASDCRTLLLHQGRQVPVLLSPGRTAGIGTKDMAGDPRIRQLEPRGFEPLTSWLQNAGRLWHAVAGLAESGPRCRTGRDVVGACCGQLRGQPLRRPSAGDGWPRLAAGVSARRWHDDLEASAVPDRGPKVCRRQTPAGLAVLVDPAWLRTGLARQPARIAWRTVKLLPADGTTGASQPSRSGSDPVISLVRVNPRVRCRWENARGIDGRRWRG